MTARISMDTLVEALARRGLADEPAARRSLRVTMAVLGERLVADEVEALARVVPAELVDCVTGSDYDSDFSADELFERVRRRERATDARARERAEIVLTALGEQLGLDLRRRIARGLPEEVGALLLGERQLGETPPHPAALHAPEIATLASGRPGSRQPLSEAAPPSGHAHSVARNPSPHEETKLSGAKGLTQERRGETLAEGHPPAPARSLANARDNK